MSKHQIVDKWYETPNCRQMVPNTKLYTNGTKLRKVSHAKIHNPIEQLRTPLRLNIMINTEMALY